MSPAVRLLTSRALALAILVILPWLAWTLLLDPALHLALDERAEIAALSEQLAHLKAVAAGKTGLEQKARALETDSAVTRGLWPGTSPAAVSADMQNIIRQVVAAGGGQIRSTSDDIEATEQGFRRVGVRFDIQGPLQTVTSLLSAAETAMPFIFVDSVTITAPDGNYVRDRPPQLTLDLKLVGYMREQAR